MSLSAITRSVSALPTSRSLLPLKASPLQAPLPALPSLIRRCAVLLMAAMLLIGLANQRPAFAQDAAPAGGIDPEAMKVLVAPVALYPDDVLAVLLPASTTGLQIVQAQRFLDQHKTNAALQPNADWDPSVLALLNYPDVVARLNADLDWTQRLGDAVINQQADVMNAIQQIRNEAVASGYLKSDGKLVVTQQQQTVVIQSANPQVVYVPNYDPQVVIQQTYVSAPPPVYYNPYPPYYSPAATFVSGLVVGGALAYAFDWDHDDIDVDVHYHDDHHDNDHHDNDHHDNDNDHHNNNDHHDNNDHRNDNDHRGNNGNRDFGNYNIDRKPGENGNKFTWNGKDKRPAARPADVTRPAGLAPASKLPGNKLPAGHPATLPGKSNNAAPKPANNNGQLQNRIGGAPSTAKPAGGFGNITPSRTTQQQKQRGAQSLQQQKSQFKPQSSQSRATQNRPKTQQFRSPSSHGAGAFGGSSNSGKAVRAQQQRGNASRPQIKRR